MISVPHATIKIIQTKPRTASEDGDNSGEEQTGPAKKILLAVFKSSELAKQTMDSYQNGELNVDHFKLRWWVPFSSSGSTARNVSN
jgi:tryptophanyl-tRNA synthetase